MRIHFLGGVDTVTGSRHLLEANGCLVLRDCGMFQGRREESRAQNVRFTFDRPRLNAVVLSHAHIDHCGNLPTLVRQGYHGPIHATSATQALCAIMLRDAARIQEQDAAYLNQKTNRKGLPPIEPLYGIQNAEDTLPLFQGCRYGERVEVTPGISVLFQDAGHILGAALTTFTVGDNGRTRRIAFAFDLGRKNLPLIRDPEILHDVDALIIESTYGDRLHDDAVKAEEQLRAVVDRTIRRGGKVLIPSFALERAQEIIYHLASLVTAGRLPAIPVFVDSPMATQVTDVFEKSADYLDEDYAKLSRQVGRVMHPPWLTYISSVEESKAVTSSDKPCIVIAASGMCEHGRILHHLKQGIENPLNTVVIVGFQASYTLGRRLVEREKRVRIFGDWFDRKAEVVVLNAFSAHADRNELLDYIRQVAPPRIFLVHGESEQREALATALRGAGFENVFLPSQGDIAEL
jgi:metallo-beta-lactamase family protein